MFVLPRLHGEKKVGKYPIKKIRTLALVGQAGSGKTALADALLGHAASVSPDGGNEHGNSTCDYLPIEKPLHHSAKLAVASFGAQDTPIHLLDTPGYPYFLGHALPALSALEPADMRT